jgi:hypothetical protein
MYDKAYVHLFGYMNGHKLRYSCQKNSSKMQESLVHSVKKAGWCGVPSFVIIQPNILGEKQLDTTTVNAKSYQETLENFLAADRRRLYTRNIWFKKVATSHTCRVSVDILRNIFPGRFISRFGGTFGFPELQT